jgi:hypothetical protein
MPQHFSIAVIAPAAMHLKCSSADLTNDRD